MPRRLLLLVACPALVLGLGACGAGSLPPDEVATGAEEALEKQAGVRTDVSCPGELDAEVGAEARCTVSVEGDPAEYGVTVTVTSVNGDTANFDVTVDEEPID